MALNSPHNPFSDYPLAVPRGGWKFSPGLLLILLATISWGFENNCTKKLAEKDTYTIVFFNGIFSGSGAIALIAGETLPALKQILLTLLLGLLHTD